MSTRIKSAAVAIVIAVILLIAHGTFLFNIAVGAISALAIYEIFRATKMTEHKYQTIACRSSDRNDGSFFGIVRNDTTRKIGSDSGTK